MKRPEKIRIRMYQVGFGDCFLLSFFYAGHATRHVLIDCGSMGSPKGSKAGLIKRVASDIEKTVGGEPFAIVATHRHTDHISGFDPGTGGNGAGAIFARMQPELVIQPWTEDPDIAEDARTPARKGMAGRRMALDNLQQIASDVLDVHVTRLKRTRATKAIGETLDFLGRDNIKNQRAVENLMTMGKRNEYLHAGKRTTLNTFLPGVNVQVLGPPTVKQHANVENQRARNDSEYWHLQARAFAMTRRAATAAGKNPLFPGHPATKGRLAQIPSRWLVNAMKKENAEQVLQIVRSLDDAMNNTSLILLFRTGGQGLLFPGDAQFENWEYALKTASLSRHLRDVTVYKVGHHGSLNATPKSLWNLWFPDGRPRDDQRQKMVSLLSTLHGKHGSTASGTEVPRSKLVNALDKHTDLLSTEMIHGKDYHDEWVTV